MPENKIPHYIDSPLYRLVIYSPNSKEDYLNRFESDGPFMNINVGDIINPITWLDNAAHNEPAVRVSSIEHTFSMDGEHLCHEIHVYTEQLSD